MGGVESARRRVGIGEGLGLEEDDTEMERGGRVYSGLECGLESAEGSKNPGFRACCIVND